jgi:hypothetical protein
MIHKLVFALLLAIAVGQGRNTDNPHCPFLVGVDMPAGKYPTKQTLYFVTKFMKPQCFFDSGEAQIIELNSAFVYFAGKPSSHVIVRCHEGE